MVSFECNNIFQTCSSVTNLHCLLLMISVCSAEIYHSTRFSFVQPSLREVRIAKDVKRSDVW